MADEAELVEHNMVLRQALHKYQERDAIHKGLWAEDEPHELSGQALHKAKRLDHHCRPGQENPVQAIDDALDLINYAAFTIRRLSLDG